MRIPRTIAAVCENLSVCYDFPFEKKSAVERVDMKSVLACHSGRSKFCVSCCPKSVRRTRVSMFVVVSGQHEYPLRRILKLIGFYWWSNISAV